MHAIEPGELGASWVALAKSLPRPKAILVASAHWEAGLPTLTGAARPETVHDFYGFPQPLYRLRYPAPGSPELASRVRDLLKQHGDCAGIDGTRGFDPGAWSQLLYMYPDADIPVVQVSARRDGAATPLPYVREFQQWVKQALEAGDAQALADYRERAPHAVRAHPSDEHFLPLHVAFGAGGAEKARAERVYDDIELAALAMDTWVFH